MVYVNGEPVAVVARPDMPVVLKLQAERLGERTYLKLWAFVLNLGERTLELIPQEQLTVTVLGSDDSDFVSLETQTPSTVLKSIEDQTNQERTAILITGIVSGLATTLASSNTVIRAGSTTMTLNDASEKASARLEATAERTARTMQIIESVYENMKVAIGSEMLRRNTLNPGVSANGHVWFYFGFGPRPKAMTPVQRIEYFQRAKGGRYSRGWTPGAWKYRVALRIPSGPMVEAVFTPKLGE